MLRETKVGSQADTLPTPVNPDEGFGSLPSMSEDDDAFGFALCSSKIGSFS